jgi:uncharacterized delta-60 repeat protein
MNRQNIYIAVILSAVLAAGAKISAAENEPRMCPHQDYLKRNLVPLSGEPTIGERGTGKVSTSLTDNTGFAVEGVSTQTFENSTGSIAGGIAIQNDGKLIAVGNKWTPSNFAVVRYLSNGAVDYQVTTLVGTSASAGGVAIDTSGRAVVAGHTGIGLGITHVNMAITRYLTNGALDATFDGDGMKTMTLFKGAAGPVAIQTDGKIVAFGSYYPNSPSATNLMAMTTRYLENGAMDTSFSRDGVTTDQVSGSQTFLGAGAIQPDGKIVISGAVYFGNYDLMAMRFASNGNLDTSFDADGRVTITGAADLFGYGMALQADGKTLIGYSNGLSVVRYLSNGVLDNTFDGDGIASVSGSSYSTTSVAAQSDGKVVVVGRANASYIPALVRYLSNGVLDTTFSEDGIQFYSTASNSGTSAQGVTIQSDGKIAMTASMEGNQFGVIRYLSNGELDDSSETASYVAVNSDRKITVSVSTPRTGFAAATRYLENGALDATFDGDGKLQSVVGISDREHGAVVQADGKLVLGGTSPSDFKIARYLSNGVIDNAFGSSGTATTDFSSGSDAIKALALQSGNILAAGRAYDSSENKIAVARYLSNGVLDNSFSNDGKQLTDAGTNSLARCVTAQSDGKVVVVGDNGSDLTVVRYLSNGTLDDTFSADGIQTTDFFSGTDQGYGCAVQGDGKILASGYNSCWGYIMARYLSNGELDSGFEVDGKTIVPTVGIHKSQRIQVLSTGQILGVGKNSAGSVIMRFLSNGVLDNAFGADNGIQVVSSSRAGSAGFDGIGLTADNRLIAVGSSSTGEDIAVARCHTCGPLDVSFGSSRESEGGFEQILEEQFLRCPRDEILLEGAYSKNISTSK